MTFLLIYTDRKNSIAARFMFFLIFYFFFGFVFADHT